MRTRIFSILLLLCCSACNSERQEGSDIVDSESAIEESFDKTKWAIKDGEDYPYRDQMLNAIVYNDTIRTLNKDEILELLGEPSYYRTKENYLYYLITQKRLASWPLHTKTLVIKFSENNTIDWIKIHE